MWARVASTIRPLSREKVAPKTEELKIVSQSKSAMHPPPRRLELQPKRVPINDRALDGSWEKRLRSGSVEPDRIIDLHGMNLATAWTAIDRGLDQAIARGDRVLLLITGHHRPGEAPIQRGRIRAAVHDWLAASRHAHDIAAVRGAHRRHGGGGSLYLILRRKSARR